MPLFKGKSRAAFSHNVKEEMEHGKPQNQSLAIAYAMKRKHKAYGGMAHGGHVNPYSKEESAHGQTMGPAQGMYGMADGGMLTDSGYQSECTEKCNYPCEVHEQASGYEPETAPREMPTHQGLTDSGEQSEAHEMDMIDRVMARRMALGGVAGAFPKREKNRNTGYEKGVHTARLAATEPGESHAGYQAEVGKYGGVNSRTKEEVKPGDYSKAKEMHHEKLAELKSMKGSHGNYSEGGQIANDDDDHADERPNEFDDLVLRDGLEENYTGSNSGDEEGNSGEDDRRNDIVERIMRSRAKRAGRNPNPA